MRDFNDLDREKKSGRITLPQNPGSLSPEKLLLLETAVNAAVIGGHIQCPEAWRIAADHGVSKLDVGVVVDRLGIRIINCQLGCFGIEKAAHTESAIEPVPAEAATRVAFLAAAGNLTCANIFLLALEIGTTARSVAEAANSSGDKIKGCQLGCF